MTDKYKGWDGLEECPADPLCLVSAAIGRGNSGSREKKFLPLEQKYSGSKRPFRPKKNRVTKWLIIGLGNPDAQYQNTRHNVGFYFSDEFAKKVNITFKEEKKIFAEFGKNANILIAKPLTFMNESGKAIRAILNYFHLNSKHLIVIHDDNDLPFGTVRLRTNGSSAGHRGIESIISHLKTENFIRLRVGIRGQQKKATPRYVLGKFTAGEKNILKKLNPLVISALNEIINRGSCPHQDINIK